MFSGRIGDQVSLSIFDMSGAYAIMFLSRHMVTET